MIRLLLYVALGVTAYAMSPAAYWLDAAGHGLIAFVLLLIADAVVVWLVNQGAL